jgi:large subunit ribosomal protein L29
MKENADKARALDAAEIDKQLRDGAEQMFRLRFQMSMGQMEGVKKYRSLRKERARMMTVIQERKSGQEQKPKAAKPVVTKVKTAPVAKPKAAAKPVAEKKTVAKPAAKKAVVPRAAAKPVAAAAKPRKSSKG